MRLIYFIQHTDGYIKIGSTDNLDIRFLQLRAEYKVKLTILGVHEGDRKTETRLHQQFKAWWRFGEWHYPSEPVLQYIADNTYMPTLRITPRKPTYRFKLKRLMVAHSAKVNDLITQTRLAKETGLPENLINRLANRKMRIPSDNVVAALLQYFGCKYDDLIEFEE